MSWVARLDAGLGVYVAGLLAPTALLAWATGFPFILPSLGPSTYVLATTGEGATRETLLGQTVGVAAAYACVRVLVGPLASVTLIPHTMGGLAQVLAVLVAVWLATVGMAAVSARHAPAYAAVLIFTLGTPSRGVDVLSFLGGSHSSSPSTNSSHGRACDSRRCVRVRRGPPSGRSPGG